MPSRAHDRLLTLAGEAIRSSAGSAVFRPEPVLEILVPARADGCSIELYGSGATAEHPRPWSPFRHVLEAGRPVALLERPAAFGDSSADASADSATGTAAHRIGISGEDESLLRSMGVASMIAIPLTIPQAGEDAQSRGMLTLFMTGSGRAFRPREVDEFMEIGRRLSQGLATHPPPRVRPAMAGRGDHLAVLARRHCSGELRNVAIERDLAAQRRQQQALAELARFALSEVNLRLVMEEAVRLTRHSLEVDFATVLEFLSEEEGLEVRATEGFPPGIVGVERIPPGRGSFTGFTLEHREPVVVEDFNAETRFEILDILREHGVRSGMSVVIEGVGHPWGVLAAHAVKPRTFAEGDIAFLQTTADVLGQAVERAASLGALDAKKRELESVTENAPDIILRFDRQARCIFANSAVRQIGLKASRIQSKSVHDFPCGPESAAAMERSITEAIDGNRPLVTECTLVGADGQPHLFECRLTPESGPAHGASVLALLRDITERRVIEDWLRYQATLLDAVGEAVTAFDTRGRIIYINRFAEQQIGWSFQEVIERNLVEVISPEEDREWGERLVREVAGGREWQGEVRLVRKDGTTFPAHVSTRPVRDERGKIIGIVGTSTDLSERMELEEQLREAQKMEAIGRLAGEVAHDFNNILTAVAGYTDLLLGELDPASPAGEFAQEIDSAAERAIRLTAQLLAFSRKQVLEPRILDLRMVVRDMEKVLRRTVGNNIALDLTNDGRRAAVFVDSTQLEQVILNLAVNAVEAMPLGGTLAIRVESLMEEDPLPVGQHDLPSGRYAILSVSDTGTGIPPEVRPHVFEPFYTTKPRGKGTGLGLATAYGIVQQSGGGIAVRSVRGEGTTFSVYLPEVGGGAPGMRPMRSDAAEVVERSAGAEGREGPAGAEAEERAEGPGGAKRAGGRGGPGQPTILVAEDEPSVRLLLMKLLPRLGYQVLEAENGAEALELFRDPTSAVDLVLTDVIMPVMDGAELAAEVAREAPDIPVLFMSGYTSDVLADRDIVEPGVQLLKKPFTVAELRGKVREALASRRTVT